MQFKKLISIFTPDRYLTRDYRTALALKDARSLHKELSKVQQGLRYPILITPVEEDFLMDSAILGKAHLRDNVRLFIALKEKEHLYTLFLLLCIESYKKNIALQNINFCTLPLHGSHLNVEQVLYVSPKRKEFNGLDELRRMAEYRNSVVRLIDKHDLLFAAKQVSFKDILK